MQVVAFVKGTRRQPQCGFSYKVLSMLNELGANYEVLNVLDEVYNPGLREAIKEYSQWPTIPQVRPGLVFSPKLSNLSVLLRLVTAMTGGTTGTRSDIVLSQVNVELARDKLLLCISVLTLLCVLPRYHYGSLVQT